MPRKLCLATTVVSLEGTTASMRKRRKTRLFPKTIEIHMLRTSSNVVHAYLFSLLNYCHRAIISVV